MVQSYRVGVSSAFRVHDGDRFVDMESTSWTVVAVGELSRRVAVSRPARMTA
jgi:hypothetical protein